MNSLADMLMHTRSLVRRIARTLVLGLFFVAGTALAAEDPVYTKFLSNAIPSPVMMLSGRHSTVPAPSTMPSIQ